MYKYYVYIYIYVCASLFYFLYQIGTGLLQVCMPAWLIFQIGIVYVFAQGTYYVNDSLSHYNTLGNIDAA